MPAPDKTADIEVVPVKRKLKANAELFCRYYSGSRNATQSYKRAYAKNKPSNKTCGVNGYKLLRNTAVRERINELMGEIALDSHIKPIQLLNEYADLAFSNLADMVDENYNLKPLKKLTTGQKKSIKKLKKTVNKRFNKEGDCIGETSVTEVELFDRVKALDALAQYTGILKPEVMQQIFFQVNNQNNNTMNINPDDIPIDLLEKIMSHQIEQKQETKND